MFGKSINVTQQTENDILVLVRLAMHHWSSLNTLLNWFALQCFVGLS